MATEIVGHGIGFPLGIGVQGGFSLTKEQSELEQAISIILGTSPGERVMRPTFGSRLQDLYFEPNNQQTAARAEQIVEEALGMWEPRVTVMSVEAYPDPNAANQLLIDISYQIKASNDERSLVYPFYLIPEE
ncbi:MAG: GPW/gp25 family protein [Chloroflexota bacterium]